MISPDHSQNKPEHRIVRNVLSNWCGHFVFMVSGFVLPRLIGDHAGQESLGIWDFGWLLVGYSHLLAVGIAGAVGRYVARYRAVADWTALNHAVSSSLALLMISSILALAFTGVATRLVPVLIAPTEAGNLETAQWMVLILGVSAALQLPLGAFNGIVSGCERFDLKNAVRVSVSIAVLVTLAILLAHGHGLVSLAVVVLASEVVRGGLLILLSWRICPQLRIGPRWVSRGVAREMLSFGGKSVVQDLSRCGLYYTNSVIVAYFLGPAALAIYARQRALVMHAIRFLNQYSHVFIPTSSALHVRGDTDELRRLFVRSTTYALYIALPIVAVLALMGGPLVRAWMGPGYERPIVLAVLALGHLGSLAQRPTFAILTGLHKHGLPAIAELVAAVASVVLGILFVGVFGWGMLGAALAVAIPVTVTGGLVLSVLACRIFKVELRKYLRVVCGGPFLASVPFILWLLGSRWLCTKWAHMELVVGVAGGGVILVSVYWLWVVPKSLKSRLRQRLQGTLLAGQKLNV